MYWVSSHHGTRFESDVCALVFLGCNFEMAEFELSDMSRLVQTGK
jgi:hypothetical protein